MIDQEALRCHGRMYTKVVLEHEARLESLEHLMNQYVILVDTLGDIMVELKKLEPLD